MPEVVELEMPLGPTTPATTKRGLIYTFYSYKGGVGRSMALANTAALLAKWGQRVLIVDWDLEAPGIERFFLHPPMTLARSRENTPGIVDLITAHAAGQKLNWGECLIKVALTPHDEHTGNGSLKLITAGMLQGEGRGDYVHRLNALNWDELFTKHKLGECIERWRAEWIDDYDIILIDSRTGISDIGSICTILFPDILVLLFTTSEQSVGGIADVMRRSREAQRKLPVERGKLSAVPVLSRDERHIEQVLSDEWTKRIAERLSEFYADWLPLGVTPTDVLNKLYIPQIAYWSFGERLPVVEKEDQLGDHRSIVAAYARLARLLLHQLDWTKIEGNEEAFPEVIRRAEEERRRAEEERRRAEEEHERAVEERHRAEELYRLVQDAGRRRTGAIDQLTASRRRRAFLFDVLLSALILVTYLSLMCYLSLQEKPSHSFELWGYLIILSGMIGSVTAAWMDTLFRQARGNSKREDHVKCFPWTFPWVLAKWIYHVLAGLLAIATSTDKIVDPPHPSLTPVFTGMAAYWLFQLFPNPATKGRESDRPYPS